LNSFGLDWLVGNHAPFPVCFHCCVERAGGCRIDGEDLGRGDGR